MKKAVFEFSPLESYGNGYLFTLYLSGVAQLPYWLPTKEVMDEIRVLRGMNFIVTGTQPSQ